MILTFLLLAEKAGCSQNAVSKHINEKLTRREKCGSKRCKTGMKKNLIQGLGRTSQGVN